MPFSEIVLQRIKRDLTSLREIPLTHQKEKDPGLDYRIAADSIEIFYLRAVEAGTESIGVAKIEYDGSTQLWSLFWQRNDLKWCEYRSMTQAKELDQLVAEIRRDMHGYFFWRTGAAQKREIER
jgi:Protein of unknown function (DUF3024)